MRIKLLSDGNTITSWSNKYRFRVRVQLLIVVDLLAKFTKVIVRW